MNYEACDGGVVVMRNEASYKEVSKNIIRLKMVDGRIRELKDVDMWLN